MVHIHWRLMGFVLGLVLTVIACDRGAEREPLAGNRDGKTTAEVADTSPVFTLQGTVQYANGTDHSGIQVYVPGTSLISITDDDGGFRLTDLASGSYSVKARADGYEQALVGEIQLPPEGLAPDQIATEPVTLASLTLKPVPEKSVSQTEMRLGSLQGAVTIKGVEDSATSTDLTRCVIALEGTPYRTTCALDGSFLLWNLPPDSYKLSARIEGFVPRQMAVRVLPGPQASSVQVELTPQAPPKGDRVLSGIIELIGPDGQPNNDYNGITVQLVGRKDLDQPPVADGGFVFGDLAPGVYRITASGKGYVSPEPIDVDLTDLPSTDVQLTLQSENPVQGPGANLRGIALKNDDSVNDMSGIQVALLGTSMTAVTDEAGDFTIGSVPPGVYQLIAQAQGYEDAHLGPIEVASGEDVQIDSMLLEKIRDYPTVLSINPADNARDVIVQQQMMVTVRFSKKMKPESLRKAISIEPAVVFQVFSGKERGDTDFDLARIILAGSGADQVARFKTRYTITIDENAEDVEGLKLQEPFKASFRTGSAAVIATRPANNDRQVLVGPAEPIEIFFNAPMDRSTLGADSLRIRPVITSGQPIISSRTDPETGWTRMLVQSNWQPGTQYEVTVEKRVRTLRRGSLENTPYTFRFETARMVQLSPQQVAQ